MSIGYQPVTMSPGSSVDDQFLNLLQAALMRAPSWSDGFNYSVNDFVTRSGKLYCALQISGPSTAAIDPSTDPGTYWQLYASGGSGSGAKNFVKAPLLTGINTVIPVGVTHSGATSVAWDTSDTTILASGALKCVFPASGSNRYVDIALNALNAEDVGITWWVGAGYRQATLTDNLVSMVLYDGTTETPIAMGALPAQGGTLQLLGAAGIPTTVLATQRLRIKIIDATAVTFWIADLSVGPRIAAGGAAISNWTDFTPILTGGTLGTIAYNKWSRNGKNLLWKFRGYITASTSALIFTIPMGLTIDDFASLGVIGNAMTVNDSTGVAYSGTVTTDGTNNLIRIHAEDSSPAWWGSSIPAVYNANTFISFECTINITQWTSNINLASDFTEYASNDGSGGIAAGVTYTTGMQYGPGGSNFVGVNSITIAGNSTTRYKVSFTRPIQATDKLAVEIFILNTWMDVSQSRFQLMYQGASAYGIGWYENDSTSIYVVFGNAGIYASNVTFAQSGTGWAGATSWKWRVRKTSNGNMAEVPPLVRASYAINSAQTPTNSVVIIQANQKDEDTHNAVTTGAAWKFTAPIAGLYQIDFGFTASVGHAVNAYINFQLYKGGNPNRFVTSTFLTTLYARGCDAGGSTTFRLNAGEYIDLRWAGSTAVITANIAGGTLTITRLGN